MNIDNNFFCEWLAELFLPTLVHKIKKEGHFSMFEYLHKINAFSELKCRNLTNSHYISEGLVYDCAGNFKDLTHDLLNLVNFCNQVESNVVYFFWLFNLFKPLVVTFLITLLLLPTTVFMMLYASSLFLYLTKHWNRLKVSWRLFNTKYLLP